MGKRGPKPGAKNAGAPKKEINWNDFESLCEIQCTKSEIASFLSMSEETLRRRVKAYYKKTYEDTYKKHSEGGLCSLRRYQWKLAEKNTTMAIWLGKQLLGQKDNVESGKDSRGMIDKFINYMDNKK